MRTLRNVFMVIALMATASMQTALADEAALKIIPKPGKTACQASSKQFGGAAEKVELCVVAGNFSHDTYILNIGNNPVLKGIDDETTKGLTGTYQGEKINLMCVPQNEAPKDISSEKIAAYQKMMNVSADEAKRMAILAETVEVGRLCSARAGTISIIEVQVLFE